MTPVGRFAPSPSGRIHLGKILCCLLAWLSARQKGGRVLLRIEDLDTARCPRRYSEQMIEDLRWLGLDWDEETEAQSLRSAVYDRYFEELKEKNLLFPCYCTRSQLHNVNAPHLSDGTYVYAGTCRNLTEAQRAEKKRLPSWRVKVPDREFALTDLVQGDYRENLLTDCGDFVGRRADGVYVYQLAGTVDDGESGVTEVVRGWDLLGSAPRQMYLQVLFGFRHPEYAHIPMLMAPEGRRLSKRDQDLDMGALRNRLKPEQLIGVLAHAAGLTETAAPISAKELATVFDWSKIQGREIVVTELEKLYR